jgi:basic membrane protein A and related proteins
LKKGLTFVTVLAAGALALAACGGSSDSGSSASPSGSASASSNIKVGLAYDIGGRGDQSFNDSAAAGLDKAKQDFGVQTKELEATTGETDAQKEERLTTLAEAGYNPIIAVGFAYATALGKVAKAFPDVNFGIIDDSSLAKEKNVASLVFAENQGSALVGDIAAQASKKANIGFVGGVNTPLIQKFQAGYAFGAQQVTPDIKVQVKYVTEPPDFSGFGDPAKGKVAAQGMYQAGADVVYHASGGSGAGVFQAAKAANALAIGVDSDQYLTAAADLKPVILTSMLKRVDVAVYGYVKSAVDGATLTGVTSFDLAKDGVGYSKSNPAVQPYEAKADELRQSIIDGKVTVPEKP